MKASEAQRISSATVDESAILRSLLKRIRSEAERGSLWTFVRWKECRPHLPPEIKARVQNSLEALGYAVEPIPRDNEGPGFIIDWSEPKC